MHLSPCNDSASRKRAKKVPAASGTWRCAWEEKAVEPESMPTTLAPASRATRGTRDAG